MSDAETPDDEEVMDDWAAALDEAGDTDTGTDTDADAGGVTEPEFEVADVGADVSPAGLQTLEDDSVPGGEDFNLDVILDVPVTIAMEIGQTKISIRNLLQLNQGSVIELDRLAGEPLDVLVNGTLIAHGEVVVVNEKFGIRLTDVISPVERVKKLK